MKSEMKAPWREWLTLHFGGKDSRGLSVLHLADSDNLPQHRIRLLALALRDRDAEIRDRAARALWKLTRSLHRGTALLAGKLMTTGDIFEHVATSMREGGALKALQTCLADEKWEVRQTAAEALGEMRVREAVEDLINAVQNDPDWHVRGEAAASLGKIGDRRAVDVLIEVAMSTTHHTEQSGGYWHPDRVVRLKCVQALGGLGDPKAFPALTRALNESGEDKELRSATSFAINQVGGELAYNALGKMSPTI